MIDYKNMTPYVFNFISEVLDLQKICKTDGTKCQFYLII